MRACSQRSRMRWRLSVRHFGMRSADRIADKGAGRMTFAEHANPPGRREYCRRQMPVDDLAGIDVHEAGEIIVGRRAAVGANENWSPATARQTGARVLPVAAQSAGSGYGKIAKSLPNDATVAGCHGTRND